jgi:ribose transport system permease protein
VSTRISSVSLKENFVNYKKQYLAVLLIIAVFVIGEVTSGNFLSVGQVLMTFKFATFIALFGLGQMLVIASGGDIDLSVGFTATIVAVLTASVMDGHNEAIPLAILIAIGVGALVGLVNGLLTVFIKLPSLVVTLAISFVVQGAINIYTSGNSITGAPAPLLNILAAKFSGVWPNIVGLLLIVTVCTVFLMSKTRIGILIRSVGANPMAAYLSGISVNRVRIMTFVACGVIAGLVGLLLIGNSGQAFKDMASSYVMPSIAAVVVGGVSLKGGETNYVAVILGAVVLQTLTNLFITFGWGDAGTLLGYGLILLVMLIAYVREKVNR